ncbi:hypothetical protein ACFOPN_15330 [Xanthomonas hyacinthi]|uniref:hypothetical protein n=1 Tax=Xanthomonas hyacinthi TaxID=56455 RepID=UPI00360AEC4E
MRWRRCHLQRAASRRRIASGGILAASASICAGVAHSAENRITRADPDTPPSLRDGKRTCFEQAL